MLSCETGKGYEYVQLGKELLLTDIEIEAIVPYYKVNHIEVNIIYSS